MTAVCAICGDAVDDDEEYDHGHAEGGDDTDDVEVVCLFIDGGGRKDKLACGADPERNVWSPEKGDVNCSDCLSAM